MLSLVLNPVVLLNLLQKDIIQILLIQKKKEKPLLQNEKVIYINGSINEQHD